MNQSPGGRAPFDHVVVLMLENRSFDNLLGYLYADSAPQRFVGRGEPVFRGVAGRTDLWNEDDATPANRYAVGKASFATPVDMCHPCPDPGEFYRPHVNCQLYGIDDARIAGARVGGDLPHPVERGGQAGQDDEIGPAEQRAVVERPLGQFVVQADLPERRVQLPGEKHGTERLRHLVAARDRPASLIGEAVDDQRPAPLP